MGQLAQRLLTLGLVTLVLLALSGCDRRPAAPVRSATQTSQHTVASLVPAATDMIIQMGCRDQLVGISNYDPKTPDREGIARVGDYQDVDWERLSQIRPSVMIIARPKEEMAPVFRERAQAAGITLLAVHSDRVEDIYPIIDQIGAAIAQPVKASALAAHVHQTFDAISRQVRDKTPVRTLIVLDETGKFIAGPRNFLDDCLKAAGGSNVAAELGKDYPTIDREKLLALDPDAIIQLIPDAPPQILDAAKRFWQGLPELTAVKNHRVYTHSESYLLLPSARVADTAKLMADDLHPGKDASHPDQDASHPLTAATQPTTTVPK